MIWDGGVVMIRPAVTFGAPGVMVDSGRHMANR